MNSYQAIRSACLLSLILSHAACQVDEAQDELRDLSRTDKQSRPDQQSPFDQPRSSNDEQDHGLVPKVGPDDAFFALNYLTEALSLVEQQPAIDLAITDSLADKSGDSDALAANLHAFDFRRNYSNSRLELMVDAIFSANDKDGDQRLSYSEIAELEVDISLIAKAGRMARFAVQPGVFIAIAGESKSIGRHELMDFLRALGPLVLQEREFQGKQAYRLGVLRQWDLVLENFDGDGDGILDQSEYERFRSQRAELLAKLQAHPF